jgi:hypothetical protein
MSRKRFRAMTTQEPEMLEVAPAEPPVAPTEEAGATEEGDTPAPEAEPAPPPVAPAQKLPDWSRAQGLQLAIASFGPMAMPGSTGNILRRAREFASFLVDTELVAVSGDNPPVTG